MRPASAKWNGIYCLLIIGMSLMGLGCPGSNGGNDNSSSRMSESDIELLYSFYAGFDALSLPENDIETVFGIAAHDIGLKYLKIQFRWDEAEPEQGNFSWEKQDKVISLAQKYGLSIIAFFPQTGTPSWAQKEPVFEALCPSGKIDRITKDPELYANFIYKLVQRYSSTMTIKFIELENEPNAICLWPDTATYLAKVDNAVYSKIKADYPDIKICSGSFHQPLGLTWDLIEENNYTDSFLGEYLSNLTEIDCFSLHDYGYTGLTQINDYPYSTQYDLEEKFEMVLSSYGKGDVPIIFTECDYDTQFFNDNEYLAAAHLVQSYILSHSKGIARGRMCQAVSNGLLESSGHGIVDVNTGTYYAGYYAFRTLRAIMINYPVYAGQVKGEPNNNDYWVEKFQDTDGNAVYVIFVPILYVFGETRPMTPDFQAATINIGAGRTATVTSMTGVQSLMDADASGNITLSVDAEPIFIEVR